MKGPRFTGSMPDGRGVRRETTGINQAESNQTRGARVNLTINNSPHAVMWLSDVGVTAVAAPGTFVKLLGTTTVESSHHFVAPPNTDNRLRYVGTVDRWIHFQVNGCMIDKVALGGVVVWYRLAKNGVTIQSTENCTYVPNGELAPFSFGGVVRVEWNDYIEVWMTYSGAGALETYRMTLVARSSVE